MGSGTGSNHLEGISVALDHDYALVGAPLEPQPATNVTGAAYIFQRAGSNWVQVAKLATPDNLAQNFFGCAVALQNDLAVVGGYAGVLASQPACTAYIFRRNLTHGRAF